RGGVKLAHALAVFGLDVRGKVAVDLGASTGGFTDCLLRAGASRVYAVDVGRGQLAGRLRNDPRVVCLEGVNARYLTADRVGGHRPCGKHGILRAPQPRRTCRTPRRRDRGRRRRGPRPILPRAGGRAGPRPRRRAGPSEAPMTAVAAVGLNVNVEKLHATPEV